MRSRLPVFVRLFVLIAATLIWLAVGLRQGKAWGPEQGWEPANRPQPSTAQPERAVSAANLNMVTAEEDGPIIQSTARISIPFGFEAALPLLDDGMSVMTSGPGACTEGEEITIAITLTQSLSGAVATDQWSGTCTGEDQDWKKLVSVASAPLFTGGEAEACGHAITRDDVGITDELNWCDEVSLVWTVFLPAIQKP